MMFLSNEKPGGLYAADVLLKTPICHTGTPRAFLGASAFLIKKQIGVKKQTYYGVLSSYF